MKKAILALCIITLLAPLAQAQEEASSETKVERFGIEAGMGLNLILPFFHTKFSYRLPVLKDQVDLFLDYTFFNTAPVGTTWQQIPLFGSKYYFQTSGDIRSWAGAALGYSFLVGGPVVGNDGTVDITTFQGVVAQAGVGMDQMFNDNFGLSSAIYISYPMGIRPEINFKVAF